MRVMHVVAPARLVDSSKFSLLWGVVSGQRDIP
jgi:hypothetical protein